jgi:hypothetical protein
MDKDKKIFNPIGFLNEYCQKNRIAFPIYTIANREGPAHSPNFEMECYFQNKCFIGHGLTIKEAKENAALKSIDELKLRDNNEQDDKTSFKIVQCSNIEEIWDGSVSEFKITFRKKKDSLQEFKTFLFSKISEIEKIE